MRRAAPWLAAALGLALTLWAFWPGYLSWDSAYQWWQARHGELDPTHPPVMVRLWQLSRLILPDPGGMLALQATLWWVALAAFSAALEGGALRRALRVLALGFWPPLFALLPHLWKDAWMIGLFTLAVACLAQDLRAPGWRWRMAALLALALACAFRFNALPGALPLLAWIGWRAFPGRRRAAALATAGGTALVWLVGTALNHVPGQRPVPVWPVLAMWDIAAVSIAQDRVLFPPDWVSEDLTVADLRRDFQPYVNVPSFESGQLRLNLYYDYAPEQFSELRSVWLGLPLAHPRDYFAHRFEVSAYLLGLRQGAQPDGLVLQPGVVAFRDNPPLAANAGPLRAVLQPRLSQWVDTPLFAPWPYLLFCSALLLSALVPSRRRGQPALAAVVSASGLALAMPLVLLAPSSDFRYLGWCVMAALLAALLAWPRRGR
ncbi:MAG: hypothetical protein KA187_09375, partial [Arenimonas sp.]|nr:hypothetical protein [Arenimonas sp.]